MKSDIQTHILVQILHQFKITSSIYYSLIFLLVDRKWNNSDGSIGPCELHLSKYGKVRELAIGSFGEWSDDVQILVRVCASRIAHFTWRQGDKKK